MSYVLDTNICSTHLKRPAGLIHRFIQHAGRLHVPTIVLGELYAWAFLRSNPSALLDKIENDLLRDVGLLPFDDKSAKEFGRLRGTLMRRGISVSRLDLMIASIARVHDYTLVTHNVVDFRHIPGLRVEDWLVP